MSKIQRFAAAAAACVTIITFGVTGVRAFQERDAKDQKPGVKAENAIDVEAILANLHQRRDGAGPNDSPDKKYHDFNDLIKGSEKIDGLFTMHRKDDHLYAEIKPMQFDQPLLAPITIARGLAMAGRPLNFGEEWVIMFHRVGDKVQVVRRNVHYKTPQGVPLGKAVRQNYTDSILMALPIQSVNPAGGMSVVIDFSDIFFTDFAQLGLGFLDRNRTSWHKVKAYPGNVELEVEATFGGGRFGGGGDDGLADHRGATVVIHYTLAKLPDPGYQPRFADDRVGHFLNAVKDFDADDNDSTYDRMINRWRLEKADPRKPLSPPKKQIVWWVEDNVPHEYRPFVEQGILEWNKAFEKIGFRSAIAVRWQTDDDVFDPEDIDHCVFRWITTNDTFAMSGLRSNPLTGEMIDGDVIFDASWIRTWKEEYAFLTGTPVPTGSGATATARPLAIGEIISPMMAAKEGYGLIAPQPGLLGRSNRLDPAAPVLDVVPADWSPMAIRLRERLAGGRFNACQFSQGMRAEYSLAALAFADAGKTDASGKLPEEFIGQAIKEVVMHEVGHSLGLRHNFKASTMLSMDQINDPSITRVKGMTGSVMDYNPINLVPKGRKQGDYITTTIGPYDYWAIEYAYKQIQGDEKAELAKIAARAPENDLVFATDEDMYMNHDPLVNVYDLGSDPLTYARDRIDLASDLLKTLESKVVRDGESWSRVKAGFLVLMRQWGNASHIASDYIGGQSINRDHKGDKGGRDPISPIPGVKQREALRLIVDRIFNEKSYQFSPSLLRKLAAGRWSHWGEESIGGVEGPVHERILAVQRISLNRCFDRGVLARLENQELQADPGTDPLKISELFRAVTDGIWSDLNPPTSTDGKPVNVSTTLVRRNLQREHLHKLSSLTLGDRANELGNLFGYIMFTGQSSAPADARALARMHLSEIRDKIVKLLDQKNVVIDDVSRAFYDESARRIAKVLDASLNAVEP